MSELNKPMWKLKKRQKLENNELHEKFGFTRKSFVFVQDKKCVRLHSWSKRWQTCFCIGQQGASSTIAFLFFVIASLRPMSKQAEMGLVQRVISTLTHQKMVLELDTDQELVDPLIMQRTNNDFGIMRSNIAKKMFAFFMKLLELNEHSLCPCLRSHQWHCFVLCDGDYSHIPVIVICSRCTKEALQHFVMYN